MRICGAVVLIVLLLGFAKFWEKKVFLILLLLSGACLASAALAEMGMQKSELTAIEKNEAGTGSSQQDLVAKVGEEEVSLTVTVPEKAYTQQEADVILSEEAEALPERILGGNASFEKIDHNLSLPETGVNPAVSINWFSSAPKILSGQGMIGDTVPEDGTRVTLTAYLKLKGEKVTFEQVVTVYPTARSGNLKEDLEREVRLSNLEKESQEIVLPPDFEGQQVRWFEAPQNSAPFLAGMVLVAGIFLYVNTRNQEEKKRKLRMERLRRAYPDMVSRLLMLLYSGISMRRAFYRIAASYQREKKENDQKQNNEAFEEVVILCREIENGVTETQAYENMAERCSLPSYRTLCVLLVQNQKRGGAGIMDKMQQEVITAFGEKKRMARMAGDAASMKLLLPLGMMLMIAFALMLVPAFLSL